MNTLQTIARDLLVCVFMSLSAELGVLLYNNFYGTARPAGLYSNLGECKVTIHKAQIPREKDRTGPRYLQRTA